MDAFASVQEHHFSAGASVSGVAPTGTDSGAAWLRGRLRKWKDCTDGGLFTFYPYPAGSTDMHKATSARLVQIAWNLDGMTAITFSWRDPDGIWVPFNEPTADVGLIDLQQLLLFPPASALRVTATGATKADAAIVTFWELGWREDVFTHTKYLGESARP